MRQRLVVVILLLLSGCLGQDSQVPTLEAPSVVITSPPPPYNRVFSASSCVTFGVEVHGMSGMCSSGGAEGINLEMLWNGKPTSTSLSSFCQTWTNAEENRVLTYQTEICDAWGRARTSALLYNATGEIIDATRQYYKVYPALEDDGRDPQETDREWFSRRQRPEMPVFLSQVEIGGIQTTVQIRGSHVTMFGTSTGSWGWLMTTFAGLNVRDPALMSSLPPYGQYWKRHKTCSVVGRESGFGKEIDSRDIVVRVNEAPTEGYEDDVGVRTSVRFASYWPLKNAAGEQLQEPEMFSVLSLGSEGMVRDVVKAGGTKGKLQMLTPTFLQHIQLTFFEDYALITKPTTGIVALFWALHACKEVHTYGFGGKPCHPIKEKEGENYIYYQSRVRHFEDTTWHDFVREDELHDKLEKAGALKRHFQEGTRNENELLD